MKNLVKKILICLLAFTMFAASPLPAFASDYIPAQNSEYVENFIAVYGLEFVQNYIRSMEILPALFDSFPRNRAGEIVYPSDFGGIYINDYGSITILVRGTLDMSPFGLESLVPHDSDAIIIREVNFSYNDLTATMNTLNDLIFDMFNTTTTIYAPRWYVDVINNRVVVELIDLSPEMIDLFKSTVLDSPCIYFAQSPGITVLNYSTSAIIEFPYELCNYSYTSVDVDSQSMLFVWPGDEILLRRNGLTVARSSAGYRATSHIWGEGFVVAAHSGITFGGGSLRPGDRIYIEYRNFDWRHIGTVRAESLQSIDAAFVELEPNVIFMCRIQWEVLASWNFTTPVVGNRAYSMGARSGQRGGRINSLNNTATAIMHGVHIVVHNAVSASIPSIGGDSGGIVFARHALGQTTGVMGIVVMQSGAQASIFTRTDEINRRLNLRLPSSQNL